MTDFIEIFDELITYKVIKVDDFKKKGGDVQKIISSSDFGGRYKATKTGKQTGRGSQSLLSGIERTGAYQTLELLYDNIDETITTTDDVSQGTGSTIFDKFESPIKTQLNLKKRIFAGKQAKKKQFAARAEDLKDVVIDERGRIHIGGVPFSSKASAKTIKRHFFSDATDEYDEQVKEAAKKAGLPINI